MAALLHAQSAIKSDARRPNLHISQHKERPKALLRVGDTLWRRAADGGAAAAGVQSMLQDGITLLAPSPAPSGAQYAPPPLQLARMRGDSGTQEVGGRKVGLPTTVCNCSSLTSSLDTGAVCMPEALLPLQPFALLLQPLH